MVAANCALQLVTPNCYACKIEFSGLHVLIACKMKFFNLLVSVAFATLQQHQLYFKKQNANKLV